MYYVCCSLQTVACIALQPSGSSIITCNDIPLVRQQHSDSLAHTDNGLTSSATSTQQQSQSCDDDDDDNFVYDVYRTDDDQFDFQSLEHVLAIQALRYVLHAVTLPSGWVGCYTCPVLRPYQFGPMRNPDVTRRSQ